MNKLFKTKLLHINHTEVTFALFEFQYKKNVKSRRW